MRDEVLDFYHKPVLLNEVIEQLQIASGKWYIDATIGGGGHAQAIIKRGGFVIGIDQDKDAIEYLKLKFKQEIKNNFLILVKGNFVNLRNLIKKSNNIQGILFDLGMSTYQIKDSGRGFSFRDDERLDMRMDNDQALSAYEVVNFYTRDELRDIFRKFGEENKAEQIAGAILSNRNKQPIETTWQLVQIIKEVYQKYHIRTKINPATKVFQALRIEVNQELKNLQTGLNEALRIINTRGRILVISFHSLEDRLVKWHFRIWEQENLGKILSRKPIIATDSEININSASRSAKLRIFEKI